MHRQAAPARTASPAAPDQHRRTLVDLLPGDEAVIGRLEVDRELRPRLAELGLYPGATLRLIRRAPFGCPFEVEVAGARLCLRTETARVIVLVGDA